MQFSNVVCFLIVMFTLNRSSAAVGPGAIIGGIAGGIGAGGAVVGSARAIIDLIATSYGRGAGRLPDKTPCPQGLRDDGTSCWRDAHIYGKGCCCTIFSRWCCGNCHSGYHDDGCTCRKTGVGIKVTVFQRYRCHRDEDLYGGLCYPKCKEGYVAAGCCVCRKV